MRRRILIDVGRFEAGSIHEYAFEVWSTIARSLMSESAAWDRFETMLAKELKVKALTDKQRDEHEDRFNAFLDVYRADIKAGAEKAPTMRAVKTFLASFSEDITEFATDEKSTTRGARLRGALEDRAGVSRRKSLH